MKRAKHSQPPQAKNTSKVMVPLSEVEALGARWSARVQNQIAVINRLLKNGEYDAEMEHLHEKLAAMRAYIEDYDNWVVAELHPEEPAILVSKLKEILEIN